MRLTGRRASCEASRPVILDVTRSFQATWRILTPHLSLSTHFPSPKPSSKRSKPRPSPSPRASCAPAHCSSIEPQRVQTGQRKKPQPPPRPRSNKRSRARRLTLRSSKTLRLLLRRRRVRKSRCARRIPSRAARAHSTMRVCVRRRSEGWTGSTASYASGTGYLAHMHHHHANAAFANPPQTSRRSLQSATCRSDASAPASARTFTVARWVLQMASCTAPWPSGAWSESGRERESLVRR